MWNYETISEERRNKNREKFKGHSWEDLFDRIINLETALYPFHHTLAILDKDKNDDIIHQIFSGIFPNQSDDLTYCLHKESQKWVSVKITEDNVGDYSDVDCESFDITTGKTLPDDLSLLYTFSYHRFWSEYGGSIQMRDVRNLVKVFNDES